MKRFISHPRTGTHWLVNLIELYTNEDRYKIMIYEHDDLLVNKYSDIDVYLYRDPKYVIYSNCMATKNMNENNINNFISQYKNHLLWYLENSKIIITYKDLEEKNYDKIKEVMILFGGWDKDKFDIAYKKVTKEYTIDYVKNNNYYDKFLLSKGYKEKRNEFISQYGDKIDNEFSFLEKFKN